MRMKPMRAISATTTALRCVASGAAVLACVAACSDVLTVSNPGTLPESELSNPALEQFLINGAMGEFQFAYGQYALWSGVLADETFADHSDLNFREFSLHSFTDINTVNEGIYGNIQRARKTAEVAVDRVKIMAGANAVSSLNVARALIYAGYSYVLLGEGFCDAPVDLSAPLSPTELLARAVSRFDEGITIAGAAQPGDTAAQNLIYAARVGAARASLKKGDLAKARVYADAVPDAYERLAYYSGNSVRENNALQFGIKTGGIFLGMSPGFQGLGDVRAPQPATRSPSITRNSIYPPLKPSMYTGWTATDAPQAITVGTHIRFATGLEARYISVESNGATPAMLAFVNARRAVAGKPAVALTGSALLTEFRTQRALDFYLTGQRLGDLRRYAAAGTDLFPSGTYPVPPDRVYGTMHCFIVPNSEKAGNPHY